MGATLRYQALGPLLSGEGSRAFLGLEIQNEQRASPVVLVWVPESVAKDAQARASVERETARAVLLDHPNILRVSGIASLEEGLARVVEFADGEMLRKVLSTVTRLPAPFAARVIADACLGVHFAHMAGNDDGSPLLHGDLRPETLMVCFTGVTKVTGYGALLVAPRSMGPAQVSGRHLHVAPEQLLTGRELATIGTDVYLLGSTLYECLTGMIPFQNAPDFEQAVLSQDVTFPPIVDVPDALKQVVRRALAKKAKDRFATPLELREALERALALPETKAFESYLSTHFPDGEPSRAARRRVLDNGVADFARRQWESAAAAPLAPVPPSSTAAPSVAAIRPVDERPPPPPPGAVKVDASAPAVVRAPRRSPAPAVDPELEDAPPSQAPRLKRYAVAGAVGLAVLVALALKTGGEPKQAPAAAPAVAAQASSSEDAGQPPVATAPASSTASANGIAGAGLDGATPSPLTGGAMANAAVAQGEDASPGSTKPASAVRTGAGAEAPKEEQEVGPEDDKAAPTTGLELIVEPAVDVELNGEPIGRTPLKRELPPGRYRLSMKNKARGIQLTRSVLVKRRGMTREEIYVGKGFVTINAPPGALIAFDGKLAGKAPAKSEFELYEGNHRVVVSFSGARWQERFRLQQGERLHFDVTTE